MSLETNKYFCWVLPEDDNIDFWSAHFNEFVYRLMSEWKISTEHTKKFLEAEEWFNQEVLSSMDGFKRGVISTHIIH